MGDGGSAYALPPSLFRLRRGELGFGVTAFVRRNLHSWLAEP